MLLQGYPNLEYIIIDGGSTDGSVGIIRKYEPWLAYWVSEPDEGQSDAINKGMEIATGEFVAWLNSDDVYESQTLQAVVSIFLAQPRIALVHGDIVVTDECGNLMHYGRTSGEIAPMVNWLEGSGLAQPATFWRRSLFERVGYLRTDLQFIMDYEFFLRVRSVAEFEHIARPLARFRLHETSKTSTLGFVHVREHMQIAREKWCWISAYASKNYWRSVNDRYGRSLIAQTLKSSANTPSMPLNMLAKALCHAPSLLKESWVWRLMIKSILGNTAITTLKQLRVRLHRFTTPM